jgi:hypothetical protein
VCAEAINDVSSVSEYVVFWAVFVWLQLMSQAFRCHLVPWWGLSLQRQYNE